MPRMNKKFLGGGWSEPEPTLEALLPPVHPRQKEAIEAIERYVLFGGAMGGSKTWWIGYYCVLLSLLFNGNRGYLSRHENATFKKTTLVVLLEEVIGRTEGLYDKIVSQHNKTDQFIRFVNGSVLYYGGLRPTQTDKPLDRIKSMTLGFFGIDEATETLMEFFDLLCTRLRLILPNGTQPIYKGLLTSNPEPGWVQQTFIDNELQDHIFIPSLIKDNPSLPNDYEEMLRRKLPPEWVEKYINGVWGILPGGNYVYPYALIKQALDRGLERSVPIQLGLDIARFGEDKTIGVFRRGSVATVDYEEQKIDTQTIADDVIDILKLEYNSQKEREKAKKETNPDIPPEPKIRVLVDTVGVGGGVYDRLERIKNKENGNLVFELYSYVSGESPLNDDEDNIIKFYNRRAEAHWSLRTRFEQGTISLPNDLELISEASSIKYKISGEKKIQIESKEEMKRRGMKSPNKLDATVMAFADPGEGSEVDLYF